jgi:hypothetical protein
MELNPALREVEERRSLLRRHLLMFVARAELRADLARRAAGVGRDNAARDRGVESSQGEGEEEGGSGADGGEELFMGDLPLPSGVVCERDRDRDKRQETGRGRERARARERGRGSGERERERERERENRCRQVNMCGRVLQTVLQ